MRNKKKLYQLLFIVILSCTGTSLSAQGGYLKMGGGYALGVGKAPINSYFQREILVGNYNFLLIEQAMVNLNDSEMEVVKDSFGKGFNAGLSGGYMFSKHMGIELGISYFIGKNAESTWDIPGEKLFLTEEKKASQLIINPSLVISVGSDGISPYTRVGALIGVSPKIESTITINDNNTSTILEDKLNGGVAVGLSTALGINYPVSSKVSIFTELTYNLLSYKPSRREITRFVLNGTDMPVIDKYDFPSQSIEDVIPGTYTDDDFDAEVQLTHSYPFNNFGLNIGVHYNFNGSGGLARNR